MFRLKNKNVIVDVSVTLGISALCIIIFIPLFSALFAGFLLLIPSDWIPYSYYPVIATIPEVVSFCASGFMMAMVTGLIFKSARKIIILPATLIVTVAVLVILHNIASEVLETIGKSTPFLIVVGRIFHLVFLWVGAYLGILFVNRTINVKQNSKLFT